MSPVFHRFFIACFGGILLLLGWSAVSPVVAQAEQPITEDAFWERVVAARERVAAIQEEAPPDPAAQLAEVADRLERITAVTRADGRTVQLSLASLIRLLRAESPDLDLIEARLNALLATRGGEGTAVFANDGLAPLGTILAQEAYQYSSEPSWLQQRWRDLGEWLDRNLLRFFPRLSDTTGEILEIILLAVGVVVLAAVLFYVFRDLFVDFVDSAALPPQEGEGVPLTADAALQRAQDFSGGGDYRTAVRYLYLSALLLLEERGLLSYDRSLTNREYLGSIAHRPRLAAVLRDVIEVFDRVWYGFQPLDADEYEWYRQRVELLKQQGSG